MRGRSMPTCLVGAVAAVVATLAAEPHWGYQGGDGPMHCGLLEPAFATCADGSRQSPDPSR